MQQTVCLISSCRILEPHESKPLGESPTRLRLKTLRLKGALLCGHYERILWHAHHVSIRLKLQPAAGKNQIQLVHVPGKRKSVCNLFSNSVGVYSWTLIVFLTMRFMAVYIIILLRSCSHLF